MRPIRQLIPLFVVLWLVIGAAAPLAAQTTAVASRAPGKSAIASAHPLATAAGEEILVAGGNAFDAAVAVAATLSVVEPSGSGLGGGGFFLLHRASDGLETMIDGREKAPAAASRDMFLDANKEPVPRLSVDSPLAAGIPGEPAALAYLSAKFGRLPLKQVLQPAIRIARAGFPMYARLQGVVRQKRETLKKQPHAARIWLDRKGEVPALGAIIRQPELSRTWQLLADKGMAEFYTGKLARATVREVRAIGGIWSEQDLASYQVVERKPIVGHYRGARIVSASPPAAGGVALVDALNIIEGFDLARMDAATRTHVIVEAMRRMHRDRAVYLGDPDFVPVPVELLTSPAYAAGQRASINLMRAMPSDLLPGLEPEQGKGTQTTHFSIMDKDGNRAGVTITLNFLLGSGLMLKNSGIFLNNQMDDFSIKTGVPNGFDLVGADANAIASGKRMLSSSTPTFIESPRGLMIAGSPGGSYITGMVLLATLDFMAGKSAQDIVAAPRFHHQYRPDVVQFETGALSSELRTALEARGHKVAEARRRWGNMQVITWDYATGKVDAAADPRGEGAGHVY